MTDKEASDDTDGQSEQSTETDQGEDEQTDSLSARKKASRETERNRPDVGYRLIKRDMIKPPWKQETALTHSLKLSEMSLREDSSLFKRHVRDEHLNKYTDGLRTETERSVSELRDDLETALAENNEKEIRLVLSRLAQAAEADPSSCIETVETVIDAVESGSQPVQAEAIGILIEISRVQPERLSGAIEPTIAALEQNTHPKLSAEAFRLLGVLVPELPEDVSHAAPAFVSLLNEDEDLPDELVARALAALARETPDRLTDVVEELGAYVEQEKSEAAQKHVLAALGHTAKEHPDPVSDVAPRLVDLLESRHTKVRVNAAGVLADVADARPTAVEPAIPHAIDIFESEGTRGQHNATSIMARVAKADPEAVQPALDNLIEALEADDADTRINACQAVNHMNAESALPALEERTANDPEEHVRHAARQAVESISSE